MAQQSLQKFRENDFDNEDDNDCYLPEPKIRNKDKKKVKFRVVATEKDNEFGFWANEKL